MTAWNDTTDYEVPSLVFGSNNRLYKSLLSSGPGTAVGPRDPIVKVPSVVAKATAAIKVNLPGTSRWGRPAYANGIYVIAADYALSAYSTDGIIWELNLLPIRHELRQRWSVYGANDRLFLYSSTKRTFTSQDGINWTEIDVWPTTIGYEELHYVNGSYIGISGSNVLYSTDGLNWSHHKLSPNPHTQLRFAQYVEAIGLFVAVPTAYYDYAAYSQDGLDWHYVNFTTSGNRGDWRTATNGNAVVAVQPGSSVYKFTDDGIHWGDYMIPFSGTARLVSCSDGKFLMHSNAGTNCAWSIDGINWTIEPSLLGSFSSNNVPYTCCANGMHIINTQGLDFQQNSLAVCTVADVETPVHAWAEIIAEGVGTIIRTAAGSGTTPVDYIELDGSYKSRELYPELYRFAVESENIVADDRWTATKFSYGDGATTFRIPKTSTTGPFRDIMKAY